MPYSRKDKTNVVGALYKPEGEGPFPLIVLAHGAGKFLAGIAFYPGISCKNESTARVPILILHGIPDEDNDFDRCKDYADRVNQKDGNVNIVGYKDTYHKFDDLTATPQHNALSNSTTHLLNQESLDDAVKCVRTFVDATFKAADFKMKRLYKKACS